MKSTVRVKKKNRKRNSKDSRPEQEGYGEWGKFNPQTQTHLPMPSGMDFFEKSRKMTTWFCMLAHGKYERSAAVWESSWSED